MWLKEILNLSSVFCQILKSKGRGCGESGKTDAAALVATAKYLVGSQQMQKVRLSRTKVFQQMIFCEFFRRFLLVFTMVGSSRRQIFLKSSLFYVSVVVSGFYLNLLEFWCRCKARKSYLYIARWTKSTWRLKRILLRFLGSNLHRHLLNPIFSAETLKHSSLIGENLYSLECFFIGFPKNSDQKHSRRTKSRLLNASECTFILL